MTIVKTGPSLDREIKRIVEELTLGIREILAGEDTVLTLSELCALIAKTTGAAWAVILIKNDQGQWEKIFLEKNSATIWTVPFASPWFDGLLKNKNRGQSLESLQEVQYNFGDEISVNNLGAIPFVWPGENNRPHVLVLTDKTEGAGKGFYPQEILAFLSNYMPLAVAYSTIDFNSKLSTFARCLYQGSRRGILDHGLELSGLVHDGKLSDFIRAAVIDAETMLKVIPPREGNHLRSALSNKVGGKAEGILSRLAIDRKKYWKQAKDGQIIDSSEDIKRTRTESDSCTLPDELKSKRQQQVPGASLENELINKLHGYYGGNLGKVEFLRTRLFQLYCLCLSLDGFANAKNLKTSDAILIEDGNIRPDLSGLLGEFLDQWQEENKICMTTEWLVCWFGIRFIEDFPWDEFLTDYSPGRRVVFYKHFAVYYLYLLHCIRNFGEPSLFLFSDVQNGYNSFLESALYLLSEYAHQRTGLSRQAPLYKTLLDIWSSEAILYTVRDTYRDHLHHVLNVCLLGMVLIEAGLPGQLNTTRGAGQNDPDKMMRNWILAGLLHDVGYCVDLNQHMLKHLAFLKGATCFQKFHDQVAEQLKASAAELSQSLGEWLAEVKLRGKLDHGVVSAFHLLFLNRQPTGKNETTLPDKAWMEDIEEALGAMIKHNIKEGITINPPEEPLAFLLILCDHLQEWDRPRVDSLKLRRHVTTELYRAGSSIIEKNTIVRFMTVNRRWDKNTKKVILNNNGQPGTQSSALELSIHFRDAFLERFEPVLLWCQNSYDFQTITTRDWPSEFKVSMRFVHPLSDKLKQVKKKNEQFDFTEMDLFETYLQESGQGVFLADWIEKSKQKANSWMVYRMVYPNETEHTGDKREEFETIFKKDPDDQSAKRIIRKIPPDLYENYVAWKRQRLREAQLKCK